MEYEQFVRERQRALFRFAVVLCGDPVLAEELVQDVLARAYERWHLVAAARDTNAYVRRMLVNEFLSWRRRSRRAAPVAHFADDALPGAPDHADGRIDRIDLNDRLSALPAKQRAAIVLRYYAGLSFAEVAQNLGCRESSARSQVTRALAALRIQMTTPSPALDRES
ncbi:MAG TPA: SigE family RNA polymerase sigma factor [Jatrophihabitantaceae bacterium]